MVVGALVEGPCFFNYLLYLCAMIIEMGTNSWLFIFRGNKLWLVLIIFDKRFERIAHCKDMRVKNK